MANETGQLSGFRDMLPEQMIPRQKMIDTIKGVYEGYGFTPLDTPAIERHETLTGKYGAEGEKLMYKFADHGGRLLALRYDLTVPLARVVTQYQNDLLFPYKRYQVGNVWRGDSPQAGRYREFMQFDADTVGAKGPLVDAEVVAMMSDTMKALGADTVVNVNNRKILDGLVEKAGIQDVKSAKLLITSIDKLHKVGIKNVLLEVCNNFDVTTANLVEKYLGVAGNREQRLQALDKLLGSIHAAQEGITNLNQVFSMVESAGYTEEQVQLDLTIVRGLDYYTGIIYETDLKNLPTIGSVCSGGRFDNLIRALGGPDLPAVGTSVGVDRLFEGLRQLGKVDSVKTQSRVLITNFIDGNAGQYMRIATQLRHAGISTEVYLQADKMSKQLKLANRMGIPYVVFLGEDEISQGNAKVKNMGTGEQTTIPVDQIFQIVSPQKP